MWVGEVKSVTPAKSSDSCGSVSVRCSTTKTPCLSATRPFGPHWRCPSRCWPEDRRSPVGQPVSAQRRGIGVACDLHGAPAVGVRVVSLLRPRFSWTRIKGESDVQGGSGNGSVEEGAGSWVGADGGSPKGDRSRRRRCGGWGPGLGARAAVECEPEAGRGAAAAVRRVTRRGLAVQSGWRSIGWRSGRRGRWPVSNSG